VVVVVGCQVFCTSDHDDRRCSASAAAAAAALLRWRCEKVTLSCDC